MWVVTYQLVPLERYMCFWVEIGVPKMDVLDLINRVIWALNLTYKVCIETHRSTYIWRSQEGGCGHRLLSNVVCCLARAA